MNKTDTMDNKKRNDKYSFDFRKMVFTGPGEQTTTHLIIFCVFFLLLAALAFWMLKSYVLPTLASAAGAMAISRLRSIVKLWRGRSGP